MSGRVTSRPEALEADSSIGIGVAEMTVRLTDGRVLQHRTTRGARREPVHARCRSQTARPITSSRSRPLSHDSSSTPARDRRVAGGALRHAESDAAMDKVEQTLEVPAGAARALLVSVEKDAS